MNTNSELLTMREEKACQKQNSRDAMCCIWTAARMCPGLCQAGVQQICHGKRLWVWGTESLVCEEGWVLLVRGWKPPALFQMMWEEGKRKALNITSTAGEENLMLSLGLRCLGHGSGLLPRELCPQNMALLSTHGLLWGFCGPQRFSLPLEPAECYGATSSEVLFGTLLMWALLIGRLWFLTWFLTVVS